MRLSPHFTLEEMTRTSTGLPNTPGEEEVEALRSLCVNLLEPLRHVFGPLRVSSGFRSTLVNDAIGGAPSSQHRKGQAADVIPLREGVTRDHLLGYLRAAGLPFDQAIGYAETQHAHVSYSITRSRQQMLWKDGGGYRPWPHA